MTQNEATIDDVSDGTIVYNHSTKDNHRITDVTGESVKVDGTPYNKSMLSHLIDKGEVVVIQS